MRTCRFCRQSGNHDVSCPVHQDTPIEEGARVVMSLWDKGVPLFEESAPEVQDEAPSPTVL